MKRKNISEIEINQSKQHKIQNVFLKKLNINLSKYKFKKSRNILVYFPRHKRFQKYFERMHVVIKFKIFERPIILYSIQLFR